jgi:leucyl-tRNA synthetase
MATDTKNQNVDSSAHKTPRYNHEEIEKKWQQVWAEKKVFSPDMDKAKKPFYNLMMFPYPSAEGLHVGNMYAQTGADVHGRFKRMQGFDVFEPIGLDGFGIHSENYALKVGTHPMDQVKKSEENFYRQMHSIGTSVDWQRTVETYKPDYYKWTQWLFTEMFKAGLAYRKKDAVNWCPSCQTVLSDEQVINGECERCGSTVEKRELEQWFFRITEYAQRLLDNLETLDWTNKVKIAQKNWIGRSEGAKIRFMIQDSRLRNGEKPNFVLLHGFNGSPEYNFFPWVKKELEDAGFKVQVPALPHTDNPTEEEQVSYVLENCTLDENTILYGHSLGSVVAMKAVEKLEGKITGLVLTGTFAEPKFKDHGRPFASTFRWEFDVEKIKQKVGFIKILQDTHDDAVPDEQAEKVASMLGVSLERVKAVGPHFDAKEEPDILSVLLPSIEAFTTRPDTLYGATFMVVSSEHSLVQNILDEKSKIKDKRSNIEEIEQYVKTAAAKTETERTEEKTKTGVFSGLYALNPITNKQIPIWIADYVLMGYGTGAIMAVPAHDQRDFEFAQKYDLPIIPVIRNNQSYATSDTLSEAYIGEGELMGSVSWDGLKVPQEISTVIDDLEKRGIGKREVNFHLRDWLISRQRYWGPPIPMIYCEKCAKEGKSWFTSSEAEYHQRSKIKDQNKRGNSSEAMVGWYPVPMDQLPVELPYIDDYRPIGTGKAPLANHPEFYETTCPECGGPARRETDVSDTFLDSAWYFLRYTSTDIDSIYYDIDRVKKWLPVNIYIGGAEHAVLHLLYARFVTMVLADLKLTDFEEPFTTFFAHGLIIKDGAKMSKSKGNVVVPDEYIGKYGADTLRMYLMFLGQFSQGGDFRDTGIEGMNRFVKRVWKLMNSVSLNEEEDPEVLKFLHKTIKGVTEDLSKLSYNTAIAKLMEFYNEVAHRESLAKSTVEDFLKLIAPFAPHLTEEIYQMKILSDKEFERSIHLSSWPEYKEEYLKEDTVTVVIQVNGKRRAEVTIDAAGFNNQQMVEERGYEELGDRVNRSEVKKVIYVPGKILNLVV